MNHSFLKIQDKTFLVTGVANKKSIAAFVTEALLQEGANVLLSVQNAEIQSKVEKIFPQLEIFCCDLGKEGEAQKLFLKLEEQNKKLDGIFHSLAFLRYEPGKNFAETSWEVFSEALRISAFSLTDLCHHLTPLMQKESSVVTVSISDLMATSYGAMGPVKACLQSSVAYLAKALSSYGEIRVNAIGAGPLKTSASAGIPGYVQNYLYAEQMTLRKRALETKEVAALALFLLSGASSGINASVYRIDAGMRANAFEQNLVQSYSLNNSSY